MIGQVSMHGSPHDPLSICVSIEGISDAQILQAVEAWHDTYEDLWDEPAAAGVKEALHRAYPCPGSWLAP